MSFLISRPPAPPRQRAFGGMTFRSSMFTLIVATLVCAIALPHAASGTPDATESEPTATAPADAFAPLRDEAPEAPPSAPHNPEATEPLVPAATDPAAPATIDVEEPALVDDSGPESTADAPDSNAGTGSPANPLEPEVNATPSAPEPDTPDLPLPTVRLESIQFTPVDPSANPPMSIGVVTVVYTHTPPDTEWVLVLSFEDFDTIAPRHPASAADLVLIAIDGATHELPSQHQGEFRILLGNDGNHTDQETVVLTFQLTLPDPVAGSSYHSTVTATATHLTDPLNR